MDSKDAIIEKLRKQVAKLTALVEKQAARIAELELALAKATKNSSTSSKPPSSDLTKLCTGTIAASLSDSYDEVVTMIPHQHQLGSDETSIKDNGKKHWIWCITAATFTVFRIAKTRSREVLEQLVWPEFTGYMNFDYFSANCSFVWNYWIKARDRFLELVRQAPATKEAQNLAERFDIVEYTSE
jgi:hypothetical protein